MLESASQNGRGSCRNELPISLQHASACNKLTIPITTAALKIDLGQYVFSKVSQY